MDLLILIGTGLFVIAIAVGLYWLIDNRTVQRVRGGQSPRRHVNSADQGTTETQRGHDETVANQGGWPT